MIKDYEFELICFVKVKVKLEPTNILEILDKISLELTQHTNLDDYIGELFEEFLPEFDADDRNDSSKSEYKQDKLFSTLPNLLKKESHSKGRSFFEDTPVSFERKKPSQFFKAKNGFRKIDLSSRTFKIIDYGNSISDS